MKDVKNVTGSAEGHCYSAKQREFVSMITRTVIQMMYPDDIKLVDEWFEKHTEYYGTSHVGNEYTVDSYDLEAFSDFLRDTFPDLVYIRCCFGTGDASIWFYTQDLKEAQFY